MVYILLVYIGVVAVLYLVQRQMIYFPDKTKPQIVEGVTEIAVTTQDGLTLHAWARVAAKNQPTIIFFHGNAGHYGHRLFKAAPYAQKGYGFVLAGYRGYGGNVGKPSELGFYHDARAYLRYMLESGIAQEDIIIYGESIGTGVAVQMATEFPNIKALILESPYTSLTDVAAARYFFMPVRFLMKDRFDNLSKMAMIKTPLLVVQGMKDRIIAPRFGQALFAAANTPKDMVALDGHGHNDMPDARVADKVEAFLSQK